MKIHAESGSVLLLTLMTLFAPVSCTATKNAPPRVERRGLSIHEIHEGFRNPPATARPFVRWWWNNNQVEEKELLRELDLLKSAGIGGVEINPIAGPKSAETSRAPALRWRSPEWDLALLAACRGARDRGLIVDLIAGSGWPFGGEFLKPDEQIMRLSTVKQEVSGPGAVERPLSQLKGKHNGTVRFLVLHPVPLDDMMQIRDVKQSIGPDGVIRIDVPAGKHLLVCGLFEQGYRKVVFGTPGAAGPTMDHFQKSVTRAYLDRLRGVEPTWGEPLSTYVRAIFCDSIETSESNWTHGILESFRARKGYDISPSLPLVLEKEAESPRLSPELLDRVRRARYDWSEHVVHVFLQNFTSEYAAFCHDHDLLSRYQAYGIPWFMGLAEGYMIPDIPESNNWLYSRGMDPHARGRFISSDQHGYMIWTRYAAAGGRLRGKKIISSEAMTNTSRVFHTPLATIKQADDMNFICGITHSVLHGFNYVPPDVPFPGWIRFGSFFSEHNPWWPHLFRWTDYNARLSHVFQETTAVGEVALLGPAADIWSRYGLSRPEFHLTPDYFHRLWEPLSQMGINSDYLHEGALQKAQIAGGALRYGPMAYRVLLVVDAESLHPETAETIERFAKQGGHVIFVNRTPSRAPGLADAETADQKVKSAMAGAFRTGARRVPPPAEKASLEDLRNWLAATLKGSEIRFDCTVDRPRDGLYGLRHHAPDADLFFFTNTYIKESSRTHVSFRLGKRGLWRWDPETGHRTPYELPYDEKGFELDLTPLESILLVTGEKMAPARTERPGGNPFVLDHPWQVTFHPFPKGDPFTKTMDALSDFTKHADARVKAFSGTAVYRTTFDMADETYAFLDLGWDNLFVSEVSLNGTALGVNWYGSKPIPLRGALKPGKNELTVRYTTTLWNSQIKPRQALSPAGLMGPVRLLPAENPDR